MEISLMSTKVDSSVVVPRVIGNKVPNATSYELYEHKSTNYFLRAIAGEINFNLTTLDFDPGSHALCVKAIADNYLDSEYSNEVVYVLDGLYLRDSTAEMIFDSTGEAITTEDKIDVLSKYTTLQINDFIGMVIV